MLQQIEVKKDLIKVTLVMTFIAVTLVVLKLYDAKTNEVAKIGSNLLDNFLK